MENSKHQWYFILSNNSFFEKYSCLKRLEFLNVYSVTIKIIEGRLT